MLDMRGAQCLKVLQQYVSNKASEAEVQNAHKTADETKKKISDVNGLVDAINESAAAPEKEYQRLHMILDIGGAQCPMRPDEAVELFY
jgi:hypothetical protein